MTGLKNCMLVCFMAFQAWRYPGFWKHPMFRSSWTATITNIEKDKVTMNVCEEMRAVQQGEIARSSIRVLSTWRFSGSWELRIWCSDSVGTMGSLLVLNEQPVECSCATLRSTTPLQRDKQTGSATELHRVSPLLIICGSSPSLEKDLSSKGYGGSNAPMRQARRNLLLMWKRWLLPLSG